MKSVCRIYRNSEPARFTGNYFAWICQTPEGKIFCDTRESAREKAREYNEERRNLRREFLTQQGKEEFRT